MEWSVEDTYKVINLYSQYPCLWDYTSTSYKRYDQKKDAWDIISNSMEKTVEGVKKKLKHLRSAYLLEKKKVDSSKKSSTSADRWYVPQLFYYNKMSFLENVVGLRPTFISNLSALSEEETEKVELSSKIEVVDDSMLCDSQESPTSFQREAPSTSQKSSNSKKRKAERDHKINFALDEIIKRTQESEEETIFSHFGASVGMQLKNMEYTTAMRLMAEIQAILSTEVQKEDRIKEAMIDRDVSHASSPHPVFITKHE